MTLLQRDQFDFWTGFEDYASKHARRITPTAPQPDTWMSLAIGKVGFELGAVASTVSWDGLAWSGPPGIRAEFKITGDLANAHFESLRQGRDGIQTAFPGEHLTWHCVQGVRQRMVLLQKSVDWRDTSKPWLLFREPLEGRVQDNLRKWKTGALRRPSTDKPFGDVIPSAPTRRTERAIAPHPSLKPQAFLRQIVRASLPLGKGTVLDSFAGSGSTLAAAEALGYQSIGLENDADYFEMACAAIPGLAQYTPPSTRNGSR